MAEHLFQLAAVLLANLGCAILGGVIGSAQTRRALRAAVPASVGYHPDGPGEETVEVRTHDPDSVAVEAELASAVDTGPQTGFWTAPTGRRLLEDETLRVVIREKAITVEPWWWGRQREGDFPHGRVDEQPTIVHDAPFETAEYPVTRRVGQADGAR
jgi:hypothetical protein